MKKLILDELMRDSFSDFLEKGEIIIWTGEPNLKMESKRNKIIGNIIYLLFVISILSEALLGNQIKWEKIIMLLLVTVIFFLVHKAWNKDIKQIQYAITSQNIIFKLSKSDFRKIPMTSILKIKVIRNENHLPSIGLIVREDARFETLILHDNKNRFLKKRKTPTLEHIKNTEEVIQLIHQLIEPNN